MLVGRNPDGSNPVPTTERVRIAPLPSIGHSHADRAIRRVFVEVPAPCPLDAADTAWAFSGLELSFSTTDEDSPLILTPTDDHVMARHYGIGQEAEARIWRTVTPAALPEACVRRAEVPKRKSAEVKAGAERVQALRRAAAAVLDALRHAGVRRRIEALRLQKEPFESRGERAERFAPGTRFVRHRLWDVEIPFTAPVSGPLVIADGRFLGLGVMAPSASAGA